MIKHATRLFITFIAITLVAANADAAPRHHGRKTTGVVVCNQLGCSDRPGPGKTAVIHAGAVDANGNSIIVGRRPSGCPYEYCGCEASLYVFGEIRPRLNLASNWRKYFPRAKAAPGMAAVRSHHVMILMSHADGSNWLVHDGNVNHMTREHIVSIRGYTIVDPHSSRSEALTAQASFTGD